MEDKPFRKGQKIVNKTMFFIFLFFLGGGVIDNEKHISAE